MRAQIPQRHHEAVLSLQRACGNQAVANLVRGSRLLARQPKLGGPGAPKATPAGTAAKLAALAKYPGDAHQAWKKLSAADREAVLKAMAHRYGRDFANQFRDVAEHGKPDFTLTYQQPGLGSTPDKLKAGGWRRAGMEITGNASMDVEVWVHPSGKMIRRDVSAGGWKGQEPPVEPPTTCGEDVAEVNARLWPAMAAFDIDVEQLEANPQVPNRAAIVERIEREGKEVRGLITQLSELKDQLDEDDPCADDLGTEWMDAIEQYEGTLERYGGIPAQGP